MRWWRFYWEKFRDRADVRLVFKSGAWSFFAVLGIGLFIKFFVSDAVKVDGAQMEPAVAHGDWILFSKAPYIMPGLKNAFARPEKPVVALLPNKNSRTLLRIAATSGDMIGIDEGQFYRNGRPIKNFNKDIGSQGLIPAGYSPSDFMTAFKLPEPGDYLTFAELTMRDLTFAYSILRQEKKRTSMKPFVVVNDSTHAEYRISGFALYDGPLSKIPEHMRTDWFFWERLQDFFNMTALAENEAPQLAFSFFKGKKEIQGFKVKRQYMFLIGDNWSEANDSRYFGPVAINNVRGRAFMTLWGHGIDDNGKKKMERILEFVK